VVAIPGNKVAKKEVKKRGAVGKKMKERGGIFR